MLPTDLFRNLAQLPVEQALEALMDWAEQNEVQPLLELVDYLLILQEEGQAEDLIRRWLQALAHPEQKNMQQLYTELAQKIKDQVNLDLPDDWAEALIQEFSDDQKTDFSEAIKSILKDLEQNQDIESALERLADFAEKNHHEALLELSDYLIMLSEYSEQVLPQITAWLQALSEPNQAEKLPPLYEQLKQTLQEQTGLEIPADLIQAFHAEPAADQSETEQQAASFLILDEQANPRLVEAFRIETIPQIKTLAQALNQDLDSAHWQEWMRLAHSIKGAASVIGLDPIYRLAAALEQALDQAILHELDSKQLQLLSAAGRELEQLLQAWQSQQPYDEPNLQTLIQELEQHFKPAQDPLIESIPLRPQENTDERLKQSFFMEAPDQIMALAQLLNQPELDTRAIMRLAHTIKGSASLVGLEALQNLSHSLEDFIESLDPEQIEPHRDLLAEIGDLYFAIGEALEQGLDQVTAPISHFIQALQSAAPQVQPTAEDPFVVLNWSEQADEQQINQFLEQAPVLLNDLSQVLQKIQTLPKQDWPELIQKSQSFKQLAQAIGLHTLVQLNDYLIQAIEFLWQHQDALAPALPLIQKLARYLEQLARALRGEAEPMAGVQELIQQLKNLPQQPKQEDSEEIIRVPLKLLNQLLNQVSELASNSILMGHRLQKVLDILSSLHQKGQYSRDLLQELTLLIETRHISAHRQTSSIHLDPLEMDQYTALHSHTALFAETIVDLLTLQRQVQAEIDAADDFIHVQERLIREINETVLSARMVSVGSLRPRLEKTVREAERMTGKQVQLHIQGDHLLVDTHVLNTIRDPLMHLLRNAVDHGIEPKEIRIAAGKPEQGQIMLNFIHKGSRILIQIADDGGGFSIQSIKEAAQRHHIPTDGLDESALLQLLTLPGFSTRKQADQLSGRGVGLDVVKTAVEKIKGQFRIGRSLQGGALFELLVPISLVSVPSLFVEVAGQIMVLPSEYIDQILYAEAEHIQSLGQQKHYIYEGQAYALHSLDQLLGLATEEPDFEQGGVILLLNLPDQNSALYVRHIIERREIIVQPLSPWLGEIKGVIGACILADGGVGSVLDIPALLELDQPAVQTSINQTLAPQQEAHSVLIVDDSLSAREAVSIILEKAGYQIITAIDGFDALNKIEQNGLPHIMLVDMEMPNMNGIELTKYIRASGTMQHLPIIMITSRSSAKHRQLASKAGVDAYLTKPFDENQLIQTLEHLLQYH